VQSSSTFTFNKIVIFGVGLIGGSLALALRRAGCRGTVVGVGRQAHSLERAVQLGVIDSALSLDHPEVFRLAAQDADYVICAAPVAQTLPLLRGLAPWLSPHTVVSDVGSTKSDALDAARLGLGERFAQFVPAHPIAGREASGVGAALADLYDGRNVVLCPMPENTPQAVAAIASMWAATGARVSQMSAARHDAVFAAVSHLPHVLAFAMLEHLLRSEQGEQKLEYAGTGFRDFSRIAAASPEMWRDICAANRTALLSEIDAYRSVLDELRDAIDAGDTTVLGAVFARASAARAAWGERRAAAAATGITAGTDADPGAEISE
jgi:prephenate dehydrogenase